MRGIVVGVIIVIILLIVWASVATNLLVVNLGKSDDTIAYNNQTIRDLKRLIDSGEVDNSDLHALLDKLESDFASQETALNICRNTKTQCGTDLSACVTEKDTCTTEKSTCTGNLTQCTTEKGSCVSARATCDTNLIDANAAIVALQGQITTLGETPTSSTTTTSSSNTGQTIGITVAVTLVIVGAIWILIRRSSAKITSPIGNPPDKYRNRTSFVPSSLIRGTRGTAPLSASGAAMPESDHLQPIPSLVRQDAAFFEPPAAPAIPFLTEPTASELNLARKKREADSHLIGLDIARAADVLSRRQI